MRQEVKRKNSPYGERGLARRKRTSSNDPFGLGLGSNMSLGLGEGSRRSSGINFLGSSNTNFLRPRTEKQRKRDQLRENQETGLRKQRMDELKYRLSGYEVTRRRTAYDFDAVRTDPFTGRKEHLKVESKSSDSAPMRPLQKKEQKRSRRNYKVERGNGLF